MNFDESDLFDAPASTNEEPKKAGGRPLVPANNYLQGSFNYLVGALEKGWGFVGWELERIRNTRKQCSLTDVRTAIAPAKEFGQGAISLLLSESVEQSGSKQLGVLRKEFERAVNAEKKAREAVNQQSDQCREVEQALQQATAKHRALVKKERMKRKARLRRLRRSHIQKQRKMENVEKELRTNETVFAQSETLDFLRSRRYELTPRNLAAALAGLPYIRWETSIGRCEQFRDSAPTEDSYYSAFRAISYIVRDKRPRSSKIAIEFFREAIPKLPNSHKDGKTFLASYWFQFKKAIQTEWRRCQHPRRLPYDLAAAFIRNLKQPMSALDNVVAAQDKLEL